MQIALHQESHTMPRSALRHRPIGETTARIKPFPQVPERASRTQGIDSSTTIPQHHHHITKSRPTLSPVAGSSSAKDALPWSGFVGLGMCATILLILLGTGLVQWGTSTWQQIQFGTPRTYQTDVFVGDPAEHQGTTPSHFVAINLHGHILIYELPGGDAAQTRLYVGPQLHGPQADQVPVTLSFVTQSNPHEPAMVVHVGPTQIIYYNQHGTFSQPH